MKKLFIILALFLSLSASKASEPFWELAMVPNNGWIYDIKVSSNNNVYIASPNGVFKSIDQGDHWERIFDGSTLVLSVYKNNIVIAQRGAFDTTENPPAFISYDAGNIWSELKGPWNKYQQCWQKNHCIDNDYLYILTTGYETADGKGTEPLIYFTKDFGVTWDSIYIYSNSDSIRIYNNTVWHEFKVKCSVITIRAYPTKGEAHLGITKDFGKTWVLTPFEISEYAELTILDSLNYYIPTHDGIYRTRDGGVSWENFALPGIYLYKLLFANNSKTLIATYGKGLFYSLDSGNTWSQSKDTFDLDYNYTTAIALDSSGYFYLSPLCFGIYRTCDLNGYWEQVNSGFSSMPANTLAFSKDGDIYMSSYGIYKSTIKDWKKWEYLGYQFSEFDPILFNKNDEVFIGNSNPRSYRDNKYHHGVYRSKDKGKTWDILNDHIGSGETIVTSVINSKGYIFCDVGLGALIRSTDNGETWKRLNGKIKGDQLAINDEDHLFAFRAAKISRSTDDGETWETLYEKRESPSYMEINKRIIFNKSKTAWYGPIDTLLSQHSFCLKTIDNGRTWLPDTNFGYDLYDVRAIDSLQCWIAVSNFVEKYDYNNTVLYRSCDNGITWERMDTTGLGKIYKFGVSVSVSPDGFIFVTGANGGIYRSRDKFVSVEEKPKPSDEMIINPNPGSDFIEISVGANGRSPLQSDIKILNVYGQTVLSVGAIHELPLRFDVSGLAPGMYFVRMGDKTSKFVKL